MSARIKKSLASGLLLAWPCMVSAQSIVENKEKNMPQSVCQDSVTYNKSAKEGGWDIQRTAVLFAYREHAKLINTSGCGISLNVTCNNQDKKPRVFIDWQQRVIPDKLAVVVTWNDEKTTEYEKWRWSEDKRISTYQEPAVFLQQLMDSTELSVLIATITAEEKPLMATFNTQNAAVALENIRKVCNR